ncbi:MAG: alpha-glucuronidase [Burkholderiales bacterium]|nr:alpha-glucuronidase [Burkholderiales bacterium]
MRRRPQPPHVLAGDTVPRSINATPIGPADAGTEDGYELWLRYRPLAPALRAAARRCASAIVAPAKATPTVQAAVAELRHALGRMLGRPVESASALVDGALLLATPASLPAWLSTLELPLAALGDEGYLLRATRIGGKRATLIAANTDVGLLYGAFALLRALQCGTDPRTLDESSAPRLPLRMLNHWDNLDRTVERGYAGQSIWDWWKLPERLDQRYIDYARANASLGINGVSLNNVNAKAEILTAPWIAKAAALADVLRPYGMRVFLSVRFSSPIEIDGLATADPLDQRVIAWWRRKVAEIHQSIPDFGGFIVKANSEGQPGPQDYGRTHAEGANLIARALAPHGGRLMWRAFVYSASNPDDRAKQAYAEFTPLDGQFDANVIVQVKYGAIDFQPREPFHPLFGAMQRTPLALELMVTKEYLGFATHLAYLATISEEILQSDTLRGGPGRTVAKGIGAIAGVANVGTDRNWCGAHFDQANWYAYGRFAWNPEASARALAVEWAQQTFSTEPKVVASVVEMMMASREAVVDYMTPLGLHHLMDTGHHHGPGPWVSNLKRPEWNPVYYHQADRDGIGFDRTASGSNAIAQYAPALAARFAKPETTPEDLLLWFHHLPWDYRMRSGRSLWAELIARYDRGVASVVKLRADWNKLSKHIDARRHAEVAGTLAQQQREAQWWRDASIAYFRSVSGRRLPAGVKPPARKLAEYQALRFPFAPGCGG